MLVMVNASVASDVIGEMQNQCYSTCLKIDVTWKRRKSTLSAIQYDIHFWFYSSQRDAATLQRLNPEPLVG